MAFQTQFSKQTSAFQSPALRQITLEVQKVNGINLGQGVCNLRVPPRIIEAAYQAGLDGINRYTNPRGLESLRHALATKLAWHNNIEADPETEILVTAGATGAFEAVCGVFLNPGDEVIIFEPSYPYHVQALNRYQAQIKTITLPAPHWEIDFDHLASLISDKTKFILINTPGNPTGKVFSKVELEKLAEVIAPTNAFLVTDEIYEYMTFDGHQHISPASLESLKGRVITMGGYSKTFSITGWRIGFLVAPAPVAEKMASFLDAVYVCAPAPLQEAVSTGIKEFSENFYTSLHNKYKGKRNRFVKGLKKIGLQPHTPQGAYYLICDYSQLFPQFESMEFVQHMIALTGVGAVPSSDFLQDHKNAKWVRFCLASEDDVLDNALDRLAELASLSES